MRGLLAASSIGAIAFFACGPGLSGYDPKQYEGAAPATSTDPEIAPLPRTAKRWMLDPRRPLDAGAD